MTRISMIIEGTAWKRALSETPPMARRKTVEDTPKAERMKEMAQAHRAKRHRPEATRKLTSINEMSRAHATSNEGYATTSSRYLTPAKASRRTTARRAVG